MFCSTMFSPDLLDKLKKGDRFRRGLSDEIVRVLQTDPDVQKLVSQKSKLTNKSRVEVLQTDSEIQKVVREKTMSKYQELLDRSK
jgi:hypothetical protein